MYRYCSDEWSRCETIHVSSLHPFYAYICCQLNEDSENLVWDVFSLHPACCDLAASSRKLSSEIESVQHSPELHTNGLSATCCIVLHNMLYSEEKLALSDNYFPYFSRKYVLIFKNIGPSDKDFIGKVEVRLYILYTISLHHTGRV